MEATITSIAQEEARDRSDIWYRDRWLVGIILLSAILGLIYNAVIMLGYGPDETRHMSYVKMLLDEHRLPYLEPNGSEHDGAHTFHPPLYYLVLLPFYAVSRAIAHNAGQVPDAPEWHVVRLVSWLLCLAALPLIYQMGLRAGRGDRRLARMVTVQVGLLPIFGQTEGLVNNDSAVLIAVAVFLWLLAVKYPQDRSLKSAVWLGIWLGIGGLCKASALACDGVAFVLYLLAQDGWAAFKSGRNWVRIGIILSLTAALCGWWYVRSMEIYGTWTPLPPAMPVPVLPDARKYGILIVMMHPNFPPVLTQANWGIFYTMWSQKDWIPETVRVPIYLVLALYCLVALIGGVSWLPPVAAKCRNMSEIGRRQGPSGWLSGRGRGRSRSTGWRC